MKEPKRRINLGDSSVRDRLNSNKPGDAKDIGHVWMEQKKLAKEVWQLAPDRKPLAEYIKPIYKKLKETTKRKSTHIKEVKLNLRKNSRDSSTPKSKKLNGKSNHTKRRRVAIAGSALAVSFFLVKSLVSSDTSKDTPGVLSAGTETTQDGRTEEQPTFKVLYPSDKADLEAVTRKSPSGVLLHTYRDSIDGVEIEVTQQELPASFKDSPVTELEKVAKNFQAVNVIQIDESLVYHGLDEKTGVQSLFAVKSDTLISIRSSQKLSDDKWAGYILSLK